MSTVKWSAAPTSQGNVLTTELDGLTVATLFSAAGTAYDNRTNLNRWGWLVFTSGGSLTPTTGAYLNVYLITSLDATNYDNGPGTANPATHELIWTVSLKAAATNPIRAMSTFPFPLPPTLMKFALKNGSGVTLSANSNTVALYTANEAVV